MFFKKRYIAITPLCHLVFVYCGKVLCNLSFLRDKQRKFSERKEGPCGHSHILISFSKQKREATV